MSEVSSVWECIRKEGEMRDYRGFDISIVCGCEFDQDAHQEMSFLGIGCLTMIIYGHSAVTLKPRAWLSQITVLGPVSGAPIGCFATVSSCRAGSESWGGVERSSQICVHVCMRSRRLGGTSEFLGHLSAVGFEPTRSCLQRILSSPP